MRSANNQRLTLRAAFSRDRYDTDAGISTEGGRIPVGIARECRFNTPQDVMAYRWYEVGAEYSSEPLPRVRITESGKLRQNPYTYLSAESLALGAAADGRGQVEHGYLFFGHDWRSLHSLESSRCK